MASLLPLVLLSLVCAQNLPTIVVQGGTLVGTTTSFPSATATVNQFLGVPFAASPIRFAPAVQPTPWTKPLDVSVRKPACIQQFNYPNSSRKFAISLYNDPAPEEREDCLYLNVFAPSTTPPPSGFPVMVWIFGGSLDFGNAGQPIYDGSRFAAYEDVIIVAANYRMNIFGFPGSPELNITGQNLGFLDQRLALQWVQDNIHAVGGDPEKVTLFGNSAGAKSIDALVISYPKNPLFRAAILQSGQATIRAAPERTFSSLSWRNVTSALNCTKGQDLECVRNATVIELKTLLEHNALSFHPTVDNVTWFSDPYFRRLTGNIANVSMLTGTNNNDGSILVGGKTDLKAFIKTSFGTDTALLKEVETAYVINSTVAQGTLYNGSVAIEAIYTDYASQCQQALLAKQTLAAGYPTWRYYYNATFPNIQVRDNLGAYHGEECYLVFSTFSQHDDLIAQETGLSHTMRGAWAKFAKDPTGAGPGWPQLGSPGGDLAILGLNGSTGVTVVEQSVVDANCAIWTPLFDALLAEQ